MLVLTRKENQTIVLGDDIVITICQVAGGRVRVGLSAPAHVNIRRGELRNEIAPTRVAGCELVPG